MHKPYWWKRRKAWYVKTGPNNQKRLHEDEAEAYRIWQEMQAVASPESPTVLFDVLAENFLAGQAKSKTYGERRRYLISACEEFGKVRVRDLKPYHVTRWLAKRPTWGTESHRAAIAAVKRVLNWAIGEGLLERNPLASVTKPAAKRRHGLITDEEHFRMMMAGDGGRTVKRRDYAFRAVLIALRHSGVRPGTVGAVRVEHCFGDTWVVDQHKTRAKTGRPLIVYLSPCLHTLTRIAAAGRKSGPLFRNTRGEAWTSNAIRCRMKGLRKKLGLPPTAIAYAYRHTWATTAIVNGADLATVAELLGHSDLKMFSRHYGHLDQRQDHLRETAAKAVRKRP